MLRLLVLLLVLAGPAVARDPVLRIPLDCTLGEDCYINDYVDRDPGPGATDFACGHVTRDDHRGTDFAVFTDAEVDRGVTVIASAPGTVVGIRDEMPDIPQGRDDSPNVDGRECGNGVGIRHGGGWFTQYCHLKLGSISVEVGQRVAAGTPLGEIGFSGATNYPHVHFDVRRDGGVIDPFAPDMAAVCPTAPLDTLWEEAPTYQAGGILRVGFADHGPSMAEVEAGYESPAVFDRQSDAIVVWVQGYAGLEGDEITMVIDGPTGEFHRTEATLGDSGLKQFYRFTGRRLTANQWRPGLYAGTVTIMRDGALLDEAQVTMRIN
ncbi:MAG: M23 family metallopeptidase [Shimia sp.]